jgi:transcriptional regulator with PAS, ATPase and Fis domain
VWKEVLDLKKKIAVIIVDEIASKFHGDLVGKLFKESAGIYTYSSSDFLKNGIKDADIYLITTDAMDILTENDYQIPDVSKKVELRAAFNIDILEKLKEIPKDMDVLLVNISNDMALECITQLNQLGINHVNFIPFYPGAKEVKSVSYALTPDEVRYVPHDIENIINMGQRKMDYNTVVEIALKLKVNHLLEHERFKKYFSSIASNDYSINELFSKTLMLESSLESLIDIIDIGILGINEKNRIFVCNRKAREIIGLNNQIVLSDRASKVLPESLAEECIDLTRKIDAKVIEINGLAVNLSLMPIKRNEDNMGAIARLQLFSEEESRQNKMRIQLLNKGHNAKYTFDDIVGKSQTIKQLCTIAEKMSKTDSSILITGESGTGKELFAHAIHNASPRKNHPFIAINCAALPENLLESELFGYSEGAFTGARKKGKLGLFEFSHKGTFFLDEVEGMSQMLQLKLLRVIQEHEVMRVGDNKLIKVDTRIIAASNENLENLVIEGKFRKDLYYRLNTLPIVVPPLRKRKEDIPVLLEHFKRELDGGFTLSEEVDQVFQKHIWHGNIRELRNYVEYFTYLNKKLIQLDDLPPSFNNWGNIGKQQAEDDIHENNELKKLAGNLIEEYSFIMKCLNDGRKRQITIGRDYLYRKAKDDGILLSQYEIRNILSSLEKAGLVKISKGRGGSKITNKGISCLTDKEIL